MSPQETLRVWLSIPRGNRPHLQDFTRAMITRMGMQPQPHERISFQQVVEVLKTLSPEKLESAYDYLLFLRSQYTGISDVYTAMTDDDLVAVAEMSFEQYDAREAADTRNAPHDQ